MSFDYYAVAPAGRWPSFGALQTTLDANGAGVRLKIPVGLTSDDSFTAVQVGNGVDVISAGVAVSISMTTEAVAADDADTHEAVAALAENDVPVEIGDRLVWMGGGTSAFDWHPGFLIFAALVEDFGASVFDPQIDRVYRKSDVPDLVAFARDMRAELDRNHHLYRAAGPWELAPK